MVQSVRPIRNVLLASVVFCIYYAGQPWLSFSVPKHSQTPAPSVKALSNSFRRNGGIACYRSGFRKHVTTLAAFGKKRVASPGLLVSVEYEITRDDTGELLESKKGKSLYQFACGASKDFPTLDMAVDGMEIGETKKFSLSQDFLRKEDLVVAFADTSLPPQAVPGDTVVIEGKDATVVSRNESGAMIDFNHRFAGLPISMTATVKKIKQQKAYDPKKGCPYTAFLRMIKVRKPAGVGQFAVETISPGDGTNYPKSGDQLVIHYNGTIAATGAKVDSSYDRGAPNFVKVGAGQLIRGLDMGIMKMSLGEKACLKIPSTLGYGEQGFAKVVPSNADLIFEVELLKIN